MAEHDKRNNMVEPPDYVAASHGGYRRSQRGHQSKSSAGCRSGLSRDPIQKVAAKVAPDLDSLRRHEYWNPASRLPVSAHEISR